MFKLTEYFWGDREAKRLAAKFQWPTKPLPHELPASLNGLEKICTKLNEANGRP
jgi:hypothetical protein